MGAPRTVRYAAAAVAAVTAAMCLGGTAQAAPDTNASVSGLELAGDTLTGVLTVRSATGTAEVDPSSLRLVVDDTRYGVEANGSVGEERVTMLVVDTSGSMKDEGMATVRSSVASFLALVPADVQVGVVSFADVARLDLAPTTNRAAVQKTVDVLVSKGETSLYDGMTKAISSLGVLGERSVVLLSDGGDTQSRSTRSAVTKLLASKGVRAEVIGFGTGESDTTVLSTFAEAGGGSVASAADAKAVTAAFSAAARALDSQVVFTVDLPDDANGVLTLDGSADGVGFTATADLAQARIVPAAKPSPSATATPAAPASAVAVSDVDPGGAQTWHGIPVLLGGGLTLLFLGIIIAVVTLLVPMMRGRRAQRVDSIEWYVNPEGAARAGAPAPSASASASLSSSLVGVGDKLMAGRASTTRTMALIERADLPLRAGEWWVLRIVGVVIGVALGVVLLPGGPVMRVVAGLIGVVLGLLAPALALRFLAARRTRAFEQQLPDVLMLVAGSLSSGFSLLQALDAVARDSADPVAREFTRALAENRIGTEMPTALEDMAARVGSTNMKWTAMTIRIQQQVGGNLAETLRTTAKTLRDRESLSRQVKALSAEGKLSAYILIALPIGVFLYMMQVNRPYVELLWTRPLGIGMLVAGVVSMCIGAAWMRKVVEVTV